MDTHQNMSDSGMLNAFLDGELDSAHEETFFRTLANDSDLRTEMHDQLAIRKAIQHDAEAYTPPASATAAVFGALGFSIPPTIGATSAAARFLGRAGIAIGSAVVTTVAIFLFQSSTAPEPEAAFPAGQPAPVTLAPPPTMVVREVPAAASSPSAPLAVTTARASNAQGAPAQSVTTDGFVSRQPVSMRDVPGSRALNVAALASTQRTGRVDIYEVTTLDNPPRQMSPQYWSPTGFALQMRGISAKSNPAPTIVSQSDPVLANFNIALLYQLDDHQSFGVEVGHEAFSQHFSGREGSEIIRYEQNPMAYWISGVYQVTTGELYSGVRPYIQAQAGGVMPLGPMARLTLGLKLAPFERMSFLVGAEGTLLLYQHQDNWYNTRKIGLTYGMFYRF